MLSKGVADASFVEIHLADLNDFIWHFFFLSSGFQQVCEPSCILCQATQTLQALEQRAVSNRRLSFIPCIWVEVWSHGRACCPRWAWLVPAHSSPRWQTTERMIKAYFRLQVRPLKHCFIIYYSILHWSLVKGVNRSGRRRIRGIRSERSTRSAADSRVWRSLPDRRRQKWSSLVFAGWCRRPRRLSSGVVLDVFLNLIPKILLSGRERGVKREGKWGQQLTDKSRNISIRS